jgi:kynurenine formamidase
VSPSAHTAARQPADQGTSLPSFDSLPIHEGTGLRHAWDVLDHDLGTLALLTPPRVAAAAALVRHGDVYPLNLPVDIPDPPLFGRAPLEHEIFAIDRNTLDERIDAFYPQSSSQWDGLRHIRAREFGFFGGATEDFRPGTGPLGIEHWAQRGIAGRGVLIDLARHRRAVGRPLDSLAGEAITATELQDAIDAEGVALQPGDIACVRTGWVGAYLDLDPPGRRALAQTPRSSGLRADEDMARWLWDAHISALCLDNPAVEVIPGDRSVGSLHRRLLPMLGFALAELLDLEPLSAACAADDRWEFQFVAAPMNLPGGVGSPANAMALR